LVIFDLWVCDSFKGWKLNEIDMKKRTKRFALDIIRLVAELPKTTEGRIVGGQLIRCATSVGANYRAACRGKSKADFPWEIEGRFYIEVGDC